MGPAEWTDVAKALTDRGLVVVVDSELVYDRGVAAAAGTQLERLRSNTFWASADTDHVDLAVGFNEGAGPAAAMVTAGRASSAVLIDPDLAPLAMAYPDDLDVFAPDDQTLDVAIAMSERLTPFAQNLKNGPITEEMVDILCGTFTGDRWRLRQAELVKPFMTSRIMVDRRSLPTEDDLRAADWAASIGADVSQIWLSVGRDKLAQYLRGHGHTVAVTSWDHAPWLGSPEELAESLSREVTRVARHD